MGERVSEQHDERVGRELAESRTATGRRRYREVMVSHAPPPMTPYLSHGVVDWNRPGLSRRDRRWITLARVGAAADDIPIEQHVYAALAIGDISREERRSRARRPPSNRQALTS